MTSRVISCLFTIGCLWSSTLNAASCRNCGPYFDRLEELRAERAESVELLGKNQLALGRLTGPDSVRALKIRSNVKRIVASLEEIRTETTRTEAEANEKGCQPCLNRSNENHNAGA